MIGYPFYKEKTLFMNIRWNIILGVIALALLGWYYSLNQDHSDLQSLIKKPDSPEYVGNKMETTVFSPEGKKQYLAISDKVEYYTQDGHTDFISPLVYLFDVSDTQVKINGLNFNSSGLKLVGNLRQQVATLKEQVKTYYEINKQ